MMLVVQEFNLMKSTQNLEIMDYLPVGTPLYHFSVEMKWLQKITHGLLTKLLKKFNSQRAPMKIMIKIQMAFANI